MITNYKIDKLMYLETNALAVALANGGYKDSDSIKSSRFLGITNGKQFCYEILYFDDTLEQDAYTKVFVDLDSNELPVASY
jgi:hypothetical protein